MKGGAVSRYKREVRRLWISAGHLLTVEARPSFLSLCRFHHFRCARTHCPAAAYPDTVCFETGSIGCAVHASETVLIPGDQGMKEKQRIRKGINRTRYAGIAEKLEE